MRAPAIFAGPPIGRAWGHWSVAGVILALLIADEAGWIPEDAFTISIHEPVDVAAEWVTETFQFLLRPLSTAIKDFMKGIDGLVTALPWPIVFIAVAGVAYRWGGRCLATFAALCLFYMGITGLWISSLITLDIMLVSVAATAALGLPLGVAMAANDRVEAVMRPILDTMQTLPVFVYLIPVLLFGLGAASAIVATMIYALPPIVRMTNLGLRQTPPEILEAAVSAGSTPGQILWKVRVPLARPSILLGFNQTVMMALSMVIFVALIGAAGLGRDVWLAMRQLKIGDALEAGVAVVLMAILLDRLGHALSHGTGTKRRGVLVISAAACAVTLGVHFLVFDISGFPVSWQVDLMKPAETAVRWLTVKLSAVNDVFRTVTLVYVVLPLRAALFWIPVPVSVLAVGYLGWVLGGRRLATGGALGIALIAVMGNWESTMVTLSQVAVALMAALAVGLPLGVLAARKAWIGAVLRPVLDTLQTLPAFVYFPVIVMFYKVGEFSGMVATVIYAVAPAIRMTTLGLREVPPHIKEAAICCGSTKTQTLFKIELPVAAPTILVGINQTTMMCLAMVVYAGLVGAPGLGADVLRALGRFDIGGGFEAGTAIVILAILIDRFILRAAQNLSPAK